MSEFKLPEFFFAENKKDAPGAGFIISTTEPFWVAKVFKFDNDEDAFDFQKNNNGQTIIKVDVYNVYLKMETALTTLGFNNLRTAIREMSVFYKAEKIDTNASYHKRFITGRK